MYEVIVNKPKRRIIGHMVWRTYKNDADDKVRNFEDVQRCIASWGIPVLLAIQLRNERKAPRAIAGDVKVRVIDWHHVHSQLQTCSY